MNDNSENVAPEPGSAANAPETPYPGDQGAGPIGEDGPVGTPGTPGEPEPSQPEAGAPSEPVVGGECDSEAPCPNGAGNLPPCAE